MIKNTKFRPTRIGCPSIPATMKGMIMSIKGVQDVKIYYENRSVDVTFDDSQTNENEIMGVIGKEMGLAISIIQSGDNANENVGETCPM